MKTPEYWAHEIGKLDAHGPGRADELEKLVKQIQVDAMRGCGKICFDGHEFSAAGLIEVCANGLEKMPT